MAQKCQVGDVGLDIVLRMVDAAGAAIDVSAALAVTFVLLRPDGTRLAVEGRLPAGGADGRAAYTTAAGDLAVAGTYRVQAVLAMPGGTLHSGVARFRAVANI